MDFTYRAEFGLLLVSICACGLNCQTAVADELPRASSQPEAGSINSARDLARLTWSVLDAIEREHVAPRSHGDLIETVTRVFTGLDDGQELDAAGAEAIRCQNVDEFCEWLVRLPGPVNEPGIPFDQFPDQIVTALQSKVGHLQLIREKDHVVEEQLRNNRYVGIGVSVSSSRDFLTFAKVHPGGPAERGGLHDGTVVEEVDGRSTRHIPVETVVEWIRGPAGTEVTLKIVDSKADNDSRMVTLKRGVIRLDSVFNMKKNAPLFGETLASEGLDRIAWIRIDGVTSSTLSELRDAEVKARLEHDRVVVLDFRAQSESDNLHQAQLIADGLLDSHTVWYESRRGQPPCPVIADRECLFREFPIMVLVHQRTGPALVAIATALQDAGRAKIVGDSPEFMGTFESTVKLNGVPFALRMLTDRLIRSRHDRCWPLRPDFPVKQPGASASYLRRPSGESTSYEFTGGGSPQFDTSQQTIEWERQEQLPLENVISALAPANVKSKRKSRFLFGIQTELRTEAERAYLIEVQRAFTAKSTAFVEFQSVPLVQNSSADEIARRVAREMLNSLSEDSKK